jgi:folate-dependent phosphoribosylglycinamide formyltransferase PurN
MKTSSCDLKRPIRVVLFCGPVMERAAKQFICMLTAHPEVEFLGGFCQSEGQTFAARVRDLWRRRGVLGLPILAIEATTDVGRYITHPRSEIRLRKQTAGTADRIAFEPDIHAAAVRVRVRDLEPDLGLIYGGPIMRPELFEIPPLGTLGIHHGKVPEYRGKKTTFWAMYNDESAVGVTIQRVNAGIDTGEVVKTGDVLTAGKSYRRVWQELEELGLALYLEAILEMKSGKATFRPQAGKKGKLYKDPKIRDLLRFWWKRLRRQSPVAS